MPARPLPKAELDNLRLSLSDVDSASWSREWVERLLATVDARDAAIFEYDQSLRARDAECLRLRDGLKATKAAAHNVLVGR